MRELGELLRRAREAKGLSISDIHEATKIRSRYLEAMEQGEFEVLPGEVYVRGFLRNYAEAVGLSGDEIVERYRAAQAAQTETPEECAASSKGRSPAPRRAEVSRHVTAAVGAGAALVLLVAVAAWRHVRAPLGLADEVQTIETDRLDTRADAEPADAAPADAAPSEAATPRSSANEAGSPHDDTSAHQGLAYAEDEHDAESRARAPSQAPPRDAVEEERVEVRETEAALDTAGHELSATITERCWVRVVADGKVVFERSMLAGERATWKAEKSIRIKVGNASGIDLTYNGAHIGVLGKRGHVLERSFPEN